LRENTYFKISKLTMFLYNLVQPVQVNQNIKIWKEKTDGE